jgi:hypothetical protein
MNDEIYRFKISLKGSEPLIWRRFLVNKDITFRQFHGIIQAVMGWEDRHMYSFAFKKFHILRPEMDAYFFGESSPYANEVNLYEMVYRVGRKFMYIYDFNDDWQHEIVFEKRLPIAENMLFPLCLEGEIACPPEDRGGLKGYYRHMENSPPQSFSVDTANQMLRNLEW